MPSPTEVDRSFREELALLRLMVDGSHDYISLIDRDYVYRAVNRAYAIARATSPDAVIGRTVGDVWGQDAFLSAIKQHLDRCFSGQTVRHRASFDLRDNEHCFVDVTYYPCFNDQAEVTHAVVVTHDITSLVQKEKKLERLAYFDMLTTLPNRVQFMERLALSVANAKRAYESLAVFFIDLDNFKVINDLHGHATGDQLLRQVASRLRSSFREIDTIAHPATWHRSSETTINRLGGDEFTLVFPGVKQSRSLALLAERVTGLFVEPFQVGNVELEVTCSVGIAVFPHDGDDGETLVKHADLAMYRAKAAGKNRHAFYDPKMSEHLERVTDVEHRLRKAIETDALDVHYQPKVDPSSNQVVGCEALARWHDPDLGDVPPSQFIPIAEESGLIHALDIMVMKKACRQIGRIHEHGHVLPVSVNYSSHQFERDDIVCRTVQILDETGFPSDLLEIEITESVLIGDFDRTVARLRELRSLDVKVVLDDFGTGYSSLNYLLDLPIDALKIDRTFVNRLEQANRSIVLESIMQMAEKLSLEVIAEGVETADQLNQLMSLGQPIVQGFYYSKPLPFESFIRYLADTNDAPSSAVG